MHHSECEAVVYHDAVEYKEASYVYDRSNDQSIKSTDSAVW